MVPDHGDKYYHPTTMCPRTSITRMRKKGFIGESGPTEDPARLLLQDTFPPMRGARARLCDNICLALAHSPRFLRRAR